MAQEGPYISNLDSFLKGLEALKAEPDKVMRKRMEVVLRLAHQKVTARTPVHTGKALRNWVWSVGAPAGLSEQEALGSGDPGQTSKMALGSEPRRGINQAAADASFAALDLSQPMRSFWLSNTSERIQDLEYGQLPTAGTSRSPKGMVRVTVEEILQTLRTL